MPVQTQTRSPPPKPAAAKEEEGAETFFTTDPSSGDMLFEDAKAFQNYAVHRVAQWEADKHSQKTTPKPCLYIYKGFVYDITPFVAAHPGGVDILEKYNGKDVSVTFHDEYNHHGHTASALNMMLQYRVGHVRRVASTLDGEHGEFENYVLEELTAYPKMTKTEVTYNDFVIRLDKGLVWQCMFLTLPQYFHLIATPIFIPYCRLFDSGFVEMFSRTKYWLIPLLWIPLSLFWLLRGVFRDTTQLNPAWHSVLDPYLYYPNRNAIFRNYPAPVNPTMASYVHANTSAGIAEEQYAHAVAISRFSPLLVLIVYLSGVVLWTLTEYGIHRYIFHFERAIPASAMDNPLCKLLHLVLHGIHHIIPMDPDRLVFPPALFVMAAFVIYNSFSFLFTGSLLDVLAAGVVLGYVAYDEIHYFIHHTDPQDFYFKDLKKYHHAHHYVDDTRGYGISNKFWDWVFGTACKKA